MSEDNSWLNLMKAQQLDFQRLAQLDAEITENQEDLDDDINTIMKRPKNFNLYGNGVRVSSSKDPIKRRSIQDESVSAELHEHDANGVYIGDDDDDCDGDDVKCRTGTVPSLPKSQVNNNSGAGWDAEYVDEGGINGEETSLDDVQKEIPKAPQAANRYLTSKVKMLTKQVEDGQGMRRQLMEQMSDLQRQLKIEREENKRVKKRLQQLETESKRTTATARTGEDADPKDALAQEVASLRRDLHTAERLLKQAETEAKGKEQQQRRAVETISKLKSQLTDMQTSSTGGAVGTGRTGELEAQVRTLEKQRNDLLTAFRKQMKLIDVLKRQKIHLEAARLLAFTEEEFMKALDWNV